MRRDCDSVERGTCGYKTGRWCVRGIKEETGRGYPFALVFTHPFPREWVAEDGAAQVRRVHSDLVRAAGADAHGHEGEATVGGGCENRGI